MLLYHQGMAVSPSRIVTTAEARAQDNGRLSKRIEYRLQPVSGDNILSVAAENADGVVSPAVERAVPASRKIEKPALYMLVVGINKYKVPRLNLEYARADGEKIAETISKQASTLFSKVKMTSLYDEKAERASILAAISELEAAAPDDSVIIYLAGHGEVLDNQFNFLTHSIRYPFKAADAKQNGISFADLGEALGRLDARKITLLLDTCKSGDALQGLDVAERDQRVLGIFGGRVGLHLLAATDKGQLATELSSLGHGIFTYSLLEALAGKADLQPVDGLISVKELVTYAEDSVAQLSSQYASVPQRPTAYSRGYDFAMSRK
ncbi:MAG: caspase family protein [Rhodospirillaceae bacterium]|nr:caspase family protein [Rhodospirillaceae bacterium]